MPGMKGHIYRPLQHIATRCNTLHHTAPHAAAKAKNMEEDFKALLDARYEGTHL